MKFRIFISSMQREFAEEWSDSFLVVVGLERMKLFGKEMNEGNHLEAKAVVGGLPKSLWETYIELQMPNKKFKIRKAAIKSGDNGLSAIGKAINRGFAI